ncbi:MAG: ABC transporter permease subunit [Gammaproteobacteria bacterium]|nr:ABC transporter permease subunit [Gammaproteobacteria bacterium]
MLAHFILRKLALVIPTFIGVTVLSFSLIHLAPGDPVLLLSGERGIDPLQYSELKHAMGLDQPLYVQYLHYLWQIVQGDLGVSIVARVPVLEEFMTLFPATFELSVCALLLATVIGIPLGVWAAIKRNTWIDYGVMSTALAGYSMPIFWWGLLLILFFSLNLGWTPVSGRLSFLYFVEPVTGFMLLDAWLGTASHSWAVFQDALAHLVLPAIVLGTIPLAVIARMTRSAMLEVLQQDYIRAAYARGIPRSRVIFKHALRNALIPVVTVIGLQTSVLLTGAILTETIFSWPGVGKWLFESVLRRDYPVVQGGILLIATLIIFVNITVDFLYAVIHPKIRSQTG